VNNIIIGLASIDIHMPTVKQNRKIFNSTSSKVLALAAGVVLGWWLWPSSDEPVTTLENPSNSAGENATRLVSAIRPVTEASAKEAAQTGVLFKSLDPDLETSMNKRFSDALVAQNESDFLVAEELLNDLINDYPELPEPYVNLAAVYTKTNQLEKAQATLVNGLNAKPTTAALFESLQQVLGAQAAEAYQKAFNAKTTRGTVPLDLPLASNITLPQAEPETSSDELDLANEQLDSARKEIANLKSQYELRIASLQEELANQTLLVNNSLNNASEPQVAKLDVAPPSNEIVTASATTPSVATEPIATEPAVSNTPTSTTVAPQVAALEAQQQRDAEIKRQRELAAKALAQTREKNAIGAVRRWAAAWSSQDVQSYVSNYVDGYVPRGSGLSHVQWVSQRRDRLGNKKFINVKVSRFKVEDLGQRFSVQFSQNYKSNTINDTIIKTLTFVKGDDDWSNAKIVTENAISG